MIVRAAPGERSAGPARTEHGHKEPNGVPEAVSEGGHATYAHASRLEVERRMCLAPRSAGTP